MRNLRQPYGPIDEAALARFEVLLSAAIPQDLRQFLLESNGALFSRVEVEDADTSALDAVLGLHAGPILLRLDWMNHQFAGLIPDSMMVLGTSPYSDYYAISLSGPDTGAVYFVDHEQLPATRDSMLRVAESFTALMNRAGVRFVERTPATTVAVAIETGDTEALTRLLATGAHASGMIHKAVCQGDLRIVEILLRHGGDANERGGIGGSETPLFIAARECRADIADALIRHGADPNLRCGAGGTALQMAKWCPEVTQVLRRAGAKG
jgi:hypothetical protein